MGNVHKQEMKKLLGHSDFGPVLGDDTLTASASSLQAVAAHAVADAWVLPRSTQIKGIVIMATGVLDAGSLEYAVTYDGVVAASGALTIGARSDAQWVPLARQNAVIASSGALLEIVTAVSVDLGSAQTVRLSVPVSYIGNL